MAQYREIERLEWKREKVRKEINRLMKRKDYYDDINVYKRVSALTGLECYLTYSIETIENKIRNITDELV